MVWQLVNGEEMMICQLHEMVKHGAASSIMRTGRVYAIKRTKARNPNLYVFSAHLHMDEETPHLHIDFVPYITGSKRGLDTRVSLKSALAAEGFTGGTRGATEWNQWIAAEKWELAMVMERYGVKWLQKGTHEKQLSVLDFEKHERAKEVVELDSQKQGKTTEVAKLNQAVSTMKQELMTTTIKQVRAEEAVEKAREEGIAVQRDNETLSASNQQLRVENTSLEIKKVELRTDNRHLGNSNNGNCGQIIASWR